MHANKHADMHSHRQRHGSIIMPSIGVTVQRVWVCGHLWEQTNHYKGGSRVGARATDVGQTCCTWYPRPWRGCGGYPYRGLMSKLRHPKARNPTSGRQEVYASRYGVTCFSLGERHYIGYDDEGHQANRPPGHPWVLPEPRPNGTRWWPTARLRWISCETLTNL